MVFFLDIFKVSFEVTVLVASPKLITFMRVPTIAFYDHDFNNNSTKCVCLKIDQFRIRRATSVPLGKGTKFALHHGKNVDNQTSRNRGFSRDVIAAKSAKSRCSQQPCWI